MLLSADKHKALFGTFEKYFEDKRRSFLKRPGADGGIQLGGQGNAKDHLAKNPGIEKQPEKNAERKEDADEEDLFFPNAELGGRGGPAKNALNPAGRRPQDAEGGEEDAHQLELRKNDPAFNGMDACMRKLNLGSSSSSSNAPGEDEDLSASYPPSVQSGVNRAANAAAAVVAVLWDTRELNWDLSLVYQRRSRVHYTVATYPKIFKTQALHDMGNLAILQQTESAVEALTYLSGRRRGVNGGPTLPTVAAWKQPAICVREAFNVIKTLCQNARQDAATYSIACDFSNSSDAIREQFREWQARMPEALQEIARTEERPVRRYGDDFYGMLSCVGNILDHIDDIDDIDDAEKWSDKATGESGYAYRHAEARQEVWSTAKSYYDAITENTEGAVCAFVVLHQEMPEFVPACLAVSSVVAELSKTESKPPEAARSLQAFRDGSGLLRRSIECGAAGLEMAPIAIEEGADLKYNSTDGAICMPVAEHADPLGIGDNGTPLKSAGSKYHKFGVCKPCAFVHREGGCAQGVNCRSSSGRLKRKMEQKLELAAVRPVLSSGGSPLLRERWKAADFFRRGDEHEQSGDNPKPKHAHSDPARVIEFRTESMWLMK
eukprot:g3562.t1